MAPPFMYPSLQTKISLTTACKVWGKVMFLQVSVHWGGLCTLADPRGSQGCPPGDPNSFIFMQFSTKNNSWSTPLGKILDLPLLYDVTSCLAAWSPVSFRGSLSRGISVWRGLCLGGSLSRGAVSGRHPLYGEEDVSYWNAFLFHRVVQKM